MRKLILLFLFFISLPVLRAQEHRPVPPGSAHLLEPPAMQEDFQLFRRALTERHPGIYRYRSKASIDSVFAHAEAQLHQPLSLIAFYDVLAPVVDSIGCGHIDYELPNNWWPNWRKKTLMPPFKVRYIGDQLFIRLRYDDDTLTGVNCRILKINNHDADSVTHYLMSHFTTDGFNQTLKYRQLEYYFRDEYTAFIEHPDVYNITALNTETKQTFRFKADALLPDTIDARYKKRYPEQKKEQELELSFEGDSLAIMRIGSWGREDIRKGNQFFRCYARKALREIKKRNCPNLVIDLRDNPGGEAQYGIFLYRRLAREPFRYVDSMYVSTKKPIHFLRYTDHGPIFNGMYCMVHRRGDGRYVFQHTTVIHDHKPVKHPYNGNIFVITDGNSFSNSSNFAALVQYQKRGLIVGEETGGASNGCNASAYFVLTLPHSKLRIRVPLIADVYPFRPYTHYGRGVMPDVPVEHTVQDWKRHVDPELEMVRKNLPKK